MFQGQSKGQSSQIANLPDVVIKVMRDQAAEVGLACMREVRGENGPYMMSSNQIGGFFNRPEASCNSLFGFVGVLPTGKVQGKVTCMSVLTWTTRGGGRSSGLRLRAGASKLGTRNGHLSSSPSLLPSFPYLAPSCHTSFPPPLVLIFSLFSLVVLAVLALSLVTPCSIFPFLSSCLLSSIGVSLPSRTDLDGG
jgi:hypothetical protein